MRMAASNLVSAQIRFRKCQPAFGYSFSMRVRILFFGVLKEMFASESQTLDLPHGATVDVWQILGKCEGSTIQEVTSHCVAPPTIGDPSNLDLFPVGTHEYDDGTVTFDGFTSLGEIFSLEGSESSSISILMSPFP